MAQRVRRKRKKTASTPRSRSPVNAGNVASALQEMFLQACHNWPPAFWLHLVSYTRPWRVRENIGKSNHVFSPDSLLSRPGQEMKERKMAAQKTNGRHKGKLSCEDDVEWLELIRISKISTLICRLNKDSMMEVYSRQRYFRDLKTL